MGIITAQENTVRILIVDDEESILQLYANILQPEHLEANFNIQKGLISGKKVRNGKALAVMLCNNSQTALKIVGASGDKPFALAFLDVHLGPQDISGIELAQKIRGLDRETEIVLITGDSNINMPQIAQEIPPKDKLFYLNKPFKPLEIRQFVDSLSEKWKAERELLKMQINLENLVKERTEELSRTNKKLLTEIDEKKRAEASLRQSEENFKQMITENADSIMIVDFNGKIQFVNPATEKLFQVNWNDIVDTDFEFPLVAGERSEISIKNRPPQELVCEMHVAVTEWQGKKAYLATLRDITERKLLEERLWSSLEKNQVVMKGTIQVIARFLEMKDPYTAGHQKRVSELALCIAGKMGLDDHEQEGIHMAAMIHDIGKISIPSEILSKPGKLSDIEYDLIKTHSKTGYDILREIEFPWPVAKIVLQHHEKIDGSGYPDGIKGEAILFMSRILTVADVMEAISSHRPYRAALGIDKGIEHLRSFSGTFYDPDVVDACVNLFKTKNFEFKTKGLQAREYVEQHHVTAGA